MEDTKVERQELIECIGCGKEYDLGDSDGWYVSREGLCCTCLFMVDGLEEDR
jgi:hypothetical protein